MKNIKKVSIFNNFIEVTEDKDIMDIFKRIAKPPVPAFFEDLRELYKQEKKDEYKEKKRSISAFTVSGTFKGGRKLEYMTSYSGLIILDIDKLGENLQGIRKLIIEDQYTFACFLSPSGDGLKVIVRVAEIPEDHEAVYSVIANYFEKLTKVKIDRSGKDITRLCYFSYDPDLYLNENAHELVLVDSPLESSHFDEYNKCLELTKNKEVFEEGHRNNFIFLLANNCKRLGIPEDEATRLILSDYNYDEKEVTRSIKSAYQNNPEEYAKYANLASSESPEELVTPEEFEATPLIPDDVYAQLPAILKSGTDVFDNKRQRDVFLTGALSVLGGCFDNVSGVYDKEKTYPNLFAFIVAPAASGKGVLKFSKVLGNALHMKYIRSGSSSVKVLFIPANSSSSKVIRHLNDSGGKGIILETEADTLNNSLKQEWGDFSDMLRKAFHHESISISRTGNDQFVEVLEPRLSIALSGTPNQVLRLIQSVEDGLFSRFIFYAFEGDIEWRDARPKEGVNFEDHFKELSKKVVGIVEFLEANCINFNFTAEQWDKHTEIFSKKIKEVTQFVSMEMESSVKRMGGIVFRIAMILTALRIAEAGAEVNTGNVMCSEVDFKIAMQIALTYLEHTICIFKRMPKTTKTDPSKLRLYNALPRGEFTRAKGIEIGKGLGMSQRATDEYLKELSNGKLLGHNYGKYTKP